MVPFYGDAGDVGILQGLKGLDCSGEGAGEDLAGVEEITCYQDKIDLLGDGVDHDAAEHTEEIFVAFSLIGRGAVGFAKVDVGGVN